MTVIHTFTSSESNPPFAEMITLSYNMYCEDCEYENINPISLNEWKGIVYTLVDGGEPEAYACLSAAMYAFEFYHN